MLKKVKVGKNAKDCLAEMSKSGKMQNGLWCQMIQLDSPKLQKSREKFWYRKCKTTFHEVTEHNGLECTFHGVIFSFPCRLLDHTLSLEETQIFQFLHRCFRYFAFALTCWHIGNCFLSNLGFVLLGSHLNVTSLVLGATRGAMDETGNGHVWIWVWRRPGVQRVKPSQDTRWIYIVFGGNFVNIWEINGFFPFQRSFSLLILPRVYFDS